MLSGSAKRMPGRDRAAGYRQAFKDRRISVDSSLIWAVSHIEEKTRGQLREKFLGPNPPTAIFAANAHLTLEAISFVDELGLRIPNDLSLVGFDNAALADVLTPKLTTVERNIYEIGVAAVETLLYRIKAPGERPTRKVRLPATLHIRSSCQRLSGPEKSNHLVDAETARRRAIMPRRGSR
jgi:LacI family transcriptional regulator